MSVFMQNGSVVMWFFIWDSKCVARYGQGRMNIEVQKYKKIFRKLF